MKNFKVILLWVISISAFAISCRHSRDVERDEFEHPEVNSIYYWKTVFAPDSADYAFLRNHRIERIYLRMFDVVTDTASHGRQRTIPNASVVVPQTTYRQITEMDSLKNTRFVPVVYVTLDVFKNLGYDWKDEIDRLASQIVKRVRNMCSFNGVQNVEGIQLDCDWTVSNEEYFFYLCEAVKKQIVTDSLLWNLSSTIRLHQLRSSPPPVDYGTLMVYNTGSFNDINDKNSILSRQAVLPYLKFLAGYPLHLDIAYPTYSWQLLFNDDHFVGIVNGLDLDDSTNFSKLKDKKYLILNNMNYNGLEIPKGGIIKFENSDFKEIEFIKKEIETSLRSKPHGNVIYHLDMSNLSKFKNHEIDQIFAVDNP